MSDAARLRVLICSEHSLPPVPAFITTAEPAACACMELHTSGFTTDWFVLDVFCRPEGTPHTWQTLPESGVHWFGPLSHHRALERLTVMGSGIG